MPKRTPTDNVRDVPAGARPGQRRRLLEPAPRQLRSNERALAARERALAAREQEVADDERALATREQQVADAERALATRKQQVADAERALAAREQKTADTKPALSTSEQQKADAKRALERVGLWLPAVAKSEATAHDTKTAVDGIVADAPETPAMLAKMMALWDAGEHHAVECKEKSKNKITVNIKKPDTESMCFITSSHRTLKKLMYKYCEIQDLDVSGTKFFLELKSTDTGDAPCLAEGSVLHVFPPYAMAEKQGSANALV